MLMWLKTRTTEIEPTEKNEHQTERHLANGIMDVIELLQCTLRFRTLQDIIEKN